MRGCVCEALKCCGQITQGIPTYYFVIALVSDKSVKPPRQERQRCARQKTYESRHPTTLRIKVIDVIHPNALYLDIGDGHMQQIIISNHLRFTCVDWYRRGNVMVAGDVCLTYCFILIAFTVRLEGNESDCNCVVCGEICVDAKDGDIWMECRKYSFWTHTVCTPNEGDMYFCDNCIC